MWQQLFIAFDWGTGAPVLQPLHTTYVGDTLINNQSCQVLHRYVGGASPRLIGRIYTKADADRVWIYASGQFYKMHDFSAQPGSSWLYRGTPAIFMHCNPIQITVDSVGVRTIGGQARRWFRVHYQILTDSYRSDRIYEGVGSLRTDLGPVFSAYCLANSEAGSPTMQCYGTAAQPGLITTSPTTTCQAIPTATHAARARAAGLEVYPTVGSGDVTVRLPGAATRATVRVFSPAGQLLRQQPLSAAETTLPLGQLPRGLYLISVQQAGQPVLSRRIVLE